MSEFTIIIEDAGSNFSAYAPDVPGCVAAADSVEEVTELLREALEQHLDLLREMGEELPKPSSHAATVHLAS
jgi:predicted RNase H-like HicB family nuclease